MHASLKDLLQLFTRFFSAQLLPAFFGKEAQQKKCTQIEQGWGQVAA